MKNGLTALREIETGQGVRPLPDVSFMRTVGASLAYKYDPLLDRAKETARFPSLPQDGYRAIDNIPDDMKQYGSTLLRATNKDHKRNTSAERITGAVRL